MNEKITQRFKCRGSQEIIEAIPNPVSLEREVLFREVLFRLSNEAKEVIELIFNTPQELVNLFINNQRKVGLTRHSIKHYLHNHGWSFYKIEKTFNEIERGLKSLDNNEYKYRRKWHD